MFEYLEYLKQRTKFRFELTFEFETHFVLNKFEFEQYLKSYDLIQKQGLVGDV
jgi:hypothetical protein